MFISIEPVSFHTRTSFLGLRFAQFCLSLSFTHIQLVQCASAYDWDDAFVPSDLSGNQWVECCRFPLSLSLFSRMSPGPRSSEFLPAQCTLNTQTHLTFVVNIVVCPSSLCPFPSMPSFPLWPFLCSWLVTYVHFVLYLEIFVPFLSPSTRLS